MKPTAQRLSEVYCRPTTEEEWDQLDIQNPIDRKEFPFVMMQGSTAWQVNYTFNRTEIPVSQFIDLIQDAICSWRLEEDGFKLSGDDRIFSMNAHTDVFVTDYGIFMRARYGSDEVEVWCKGVKTYTELLTLIELIG